MSAYQIPQFLDSGDKIFMGMNIRQFGYFMAGIIGTIILFNPLYSAIGYFAFLPCLPIGLFALYLSIGKYNGRDSEIYILKSIIFFTKPRMMMYSRQPLMDDINNKMALLTTDIKEKELLARVAQNKSDLDDPLANFGTQNAETKAKIIQGFGRKIDTQGVNMSLQIAQQRVKVAGHTKLLDEISVNQTQ
jgi:PrgI family protein